MDTPELYTHGEPTRCPHCGARRQYNTDYAVIHARAGTAECPAEQFSEEPVLALIRILRSMPPKEGFQP